MLSLSVRFLPSTEGRALYRGPTPCALEVGCSNDEIHVLALAKDSLLCQFRISVPSGLFQPFNTSTSNCTESSSFSGVVNPMNEVGRPIPNEGDFRTSSVNGTGCLSCQEEELALRLSALTTGQDRPAKAVGGPTLLAKCENGHNLRKSPLLKTQPDSAGESVTGLSFQMQPSRTIGVKSPQAPTMRQFLKDRVKPDSPLIMSCASCGRTLSPDPIRFKRVEECCEGLSSELSEGWFCHAETSPSEDAQPLCLFFDSRCFYVHELTLRGLTACPGCGSLLTCVGRPVQGYTPFFCDKVEFRSSELSAPDEMPYRVLAVWMELWGMIRCAFEMSPVCKLYLHSKLQGTGSEDTCLLLSISPSKEPFFLLQGSSEVRDCFRPEPFYRVRYLQCHQPNSKCVRSWRHDFEVDFYRVSDFAATLLCTCLDVTTDDTCPIEDGFRTAFLPASLEGARRFRE